MARGRCGPAARREILLYAPRNLNDPVRCNVSGFSSTRPPTVASSAGLPRRRRHGLAGKPVRRRFDVGEDRQAAPIASAEAGEEIVDGIAGLRFASVGCGRRRPR